MRQPRRMPIPADPVATSEDSQPPPTRPPDSTRPAAVLQRLAEQRKPKPPQVSKLRPHGPSRARGRRIPPERRGHAPGPQHPWKGSYLTIAPRDRPA
jgi:hypothetical protein